MIAAKGITEPPLAEVYKLSKSVSAALLCHKGPSLVQHRDTHPVGWSLADRN
jgi:hypothetical protein